MKSLLSPATVAAVLSLVLSLALVWGVNELNTVRIAYRTERELNERLTLQYNSETERLLKRLSDSDDVAESLRLLLEQNQNEKEALGAQVQSIAGTVGILDKLSKTDKQLLAKYSSVYFLNENYVPTNIMPIGTQYLARPDKQEYFLTSAAPHLNALLQAASSSGIRLQVLSAYRSFDTQAVLKEGYRVTYGAGTANAFSADQGYSEHQLGSTLDFTAPELKGGLTGFERTAGFAWLKDHAHEYGFILSYPKGNGHFIFEPWHWRYVGVELASRLHAEGRNFYDLDQRLIDTYLISFND